MGKTYMSFYISYADVVFATLTPVHVQYECKEERKTETVRAA